MNSKTFLTLSLLLNACDNTKILPDKDPKEVPDPDCHFSIVKLVEQVTGDTKICLEDGQKVVFEDIYPLAIQMSDQDDNLTLQMYSESEPRPYDVIVSSQHCEINTTISGLGLDFFTVSEKTINTGERVTISKLMAQNPYSLSPDPDTCELQATKACETLILTEENGTICAHFE